MKQFSDLKIQIINSDKRKYMPLLLIGDECEKMIDRYLDRGILFAAFHGNDTVAVCVITYESDLITEIKNLAVEEEYRRHGIGRRMLSHVENLHQGHTMILGTGETPSTLNFYKACGYAYSHRLPGFFTDNYPVPIVEEGILLKDMVYLTKHL